MKDLARTRWLGCALLLLTAPALAAAEPPEDPPNILWLSVEDIGPHLGVYDDSNAHTPNLDAFAERSSTYRYAWSDGPVCAAARTSIIAGMDPTSTAGQHMRSITNLPDGALMFPAYLRDVGYYTTNNHKEDYNYRRSGREPWDQSNRQAHYNNRADNQPFFAVFNSHITHESQVFGRHDELDDEQIPDDLTFPAHHPDLPEVRRAWATYHMLITEMDRWFGQMLQELEDEGLMEDTIVFFWGDHGAGLPRHKRWPFNSGLHVPLIIHVPEKYQHLAPEDYMPGEMNDRLVAFQDFAPTLLSLAGVEPPEHMHGQAFMGEHVDAPRDHLFGFRGRMDERIDMVRAVRDEQYIYIRNYKPHRIYGQHLRYMYNSPFSPAWEQAYAQGELTPPDTFYWEPKPAEELYDLESDPGEVHNLAHTPEHQGRLESFRRIARQRALAIRDTGFMPEGMVHRLAGDQTAYAMAQDDERYPLETIYDAAQRAADRNPEYIPELVQMLGHEHEAVRYWAVTGLRIRGQHAVWPHRDTLGAMMSSAGEDPNVRVAAAEALAFHGNRDDVNQALDNLVELADLRQHDTYTSLAAMNVLDLLGDRIRPVLDQLADLPPTHGSEPGRAGGYPGRIFEKFENDFESFRRSD